ncbi:S-layer homology domain-containing protein [Paenibacillus sp. UNCCL117]|uniref:S-layer homology domain-containing protein n=1 Tax=unclassified Paenibacillus TaxID=185978 RepID=UPI00088B7E82|nr:MULTISPECIES: S-layer homology domain-containing protein [unclassified Paenibacillus]SDD65345.1 S-layer homology domain-containing protein [Paenibacillus sp. cl123]SFW58141.1 S-layer homology domain-containing protein [Paenibacillus sp. UNCCL117]
MLKKALFSLCLIVLSITFLTSRTHAEPDTAAAAAKLTGSAASLKAGDSLTVSVSLQHVADAYGVQFELVYDTAKLKLLSRSVAAGYSDARELEAAGTAAALPSMYPLLRNNIGDTGYKSKVELASFTIQALEPGNASVGLTGLKVVSTERFLNEFGRNDLRVIPVQTDSPLQLTILAKDWGTGSEQSGGSGGGAGVPAVTWPEALKENPSREELSQAADQWLRLLQMADTAIPSTRREEMNLQLARLMERLLDLPLQIAPGTGTGTATQTGNAASHSQAYLTVDASLLKKAVQTAAGLMEAATARGLQADMPSFVRLQVQGNEAIPVRISGEVLQALSDTNMAVKLESAGAALLFPWKSLKSGDASASDVALTIRPRTEEVRTERGASYLPAAVYEFQAERLTNTRAEPVPSFADGVEVTIAYAGDRFDAEKLGVYYWNETKGAWEFLRGGKHDPARHTFQLRLSHFSKYGVLEYAKSYTDLADVYEEARKAIGILTARHVIQGVEDDRYAPFKPVTRAEFATLLARAFAWEEAPYSGAFADVQEGDWFAGAVEAGYKAGAIQGDGTSFHPHERLTREEMIVLLMRAYAKVHSLPEPSTELFHDDALISGWAKPAVYQARALGFVSGVGSGLAAPGQETNRADTAVVLYNILKAMELSR